MTTVDPTLARAPAPERAGRQDPLRRLPAWARFALYAVVFVVLLSITEEVTGERAMTRARTWTSALELAMPIALAGLGGLWAERAGVVNIGLEGMMALGTWFGAWGCIEHGPWAGVVIGVTGGALGGLLHAIATVSFGVDHIVSGVAVNILGAGATRFLNTEVFESANDSPSIPATVGEVDVPVVGDAAGWLGEQGRFFISPVGRIVEGLTSEISLLVILGLLMFPLTWYILWRTPVGLRLRSVGEDPVAAESVGVRVYAMKYLGVVVSGALAGLGGVTLVYVFAQRFQVGQTNGRGFIGLAAMIFGNWRPGGLAVGAGLFGLTDAVSLQSDDTSHALLLLVALGAALLVLRALVLRRWRSALVVLGAAAAAAIWYRVTEEVPNEIITFLPHLTTLLVLAFASQRLRMPAADGRPYRRGESG